MPSEPVRIPRGDFAERRRALGAALAERGFAGWIACADDRPFSGGDHVRWLCDFQAHFEPVVLAGRGDDALLLTGPESSGLAALDVAETGVGEVRAAREFAFPGLEYASIELIDGRAALRRLLGDGRIAVLGDPSGAAALVGELELAAADDGGVRAARGQDGRRARGDRCLLRGGLRRPARGGRAPSPPAGASARSPPRPTPPCAAPGRRASRWTRWSAPASAAARSSPARPTAVRPPASSWR